MYHILFIYSAADRCLGCFHILAFVNNASMNIRLHTYLHKLVFLFFTLSRWLSSKTTNNKCWQGWKERKPLCTVGRNACWHSYRWKTVWRFLNKLKIEVLYDLLLVTYLKNQKYHSNCFWIVIQKVPQDRDTICSPE